MTARRVLVALAGVLLLAGCGDGAGGSGVKGVDVELPDGGTVVCVSQGGGGIDCDWDGARS